MAQSSDGITEARYWREVRLDDSIYGVSAPKLQRLRDYYPNREIETFGDLAEFSDGELARPPAMGRKSVAELRLAISHVQYPTAALTREEIDAARALIGAKGQPSAKDENDERVAKAIWEQRRRFTMRMRNKDIGPFSKIVANDIGLYLEARAAINEFRKPKGGA